MPLDTVKAHENFERYSYARDSGHTDFVKKARKCEQYFAGAQWEESIRRRLERQGKPVLTINKVIATLGNVFGEQINNRADITFRPFRNGNEQTAEALSLVYLQISNNNKLDWKESEVFADGNIQSRGFYDVRMDYDDQMRGEVRIDLLNPSNCVVDPDAEEYDPAAWKEVFVTKWQSPNDIANLYDPAMARHLAAKDVDYSYGFDSISEHRSAFGGSRSVVGLHSADKNVRRMIRVIERQYKERRRREFFVNPETGDMRPVPDNWDRERISRVLNDYAPLTIFERVTEQIRWCVTADDVLLHEAWSPYKYFTPVPYFPFFRRGVTIGLVENLISPQDVLNKSRSQELHVINTTANSGWKLKQGSLQNMDPDELEQRGAETGLVLELADVNDAEKIQPNQIPTGLDRVSFKADEDIKEISGVGDSQRGLDRADVAAKAIRYKQAAGAINLAKPMDNLAFTRGLVAERVLNLMQTYYTEERVMQITRRGISAQPEDLVVNQVNVEGVVVNDLTAGEYAVVVTAVPSHDTYLQSQFDEALMLRRDAGVAIPDEFMIEHSHLNRKAEIIKQIKEISGGAEPSEAQQQLAELEMQAKQLDNQLKEVDIQKRAAEVQLNQARAAKEAAEAQGGDGAAQVELELKREQAAADIVLQREKLAADIEFKREELAATLQMKREEARQQNLLKRAEAAERIDQQREQAQPAATEAA